MELIGMFVLLGMVNHQVTQIITVGAIFDTFRQKMWDIHPKLGYLFRCHLCFGTWVGLVEGAFVPLAVHDSAIVSWLLVSFAVAMIGRAFNEALAFVACQVRVSKAQAEGIEESNLQQRRMFEAQGD